MRERDIRPYFIFRLEFFKIAYHLLAMALIGLAAFPAVSLLYFSWKALAGAAALWRVFAVAFLIGPAYFVFGLSLILISVAARFCLRLSIRPGHYRIFEDWGAIQWMGYNAFVLLVNALFLDGFRISPIQNLFYRAMGARIGRGAQINTCGLADLSMIEIGENTIIGGGVTLICHSAERGLLKLSPVRIGRNVSVGLDTIIMPDTEIGDGASVAPRSFLPAGTRIPANGRFGGHPARDLKAESTNGAKSGRDNRNANT